MELGTGELCYVRMLQGILTARVPPMSVRAGDDTPCTKIQMYIIVEAQPMLIL